MPSGQNPHALEDDAARRPINPAWANECRGSRQFVYAILAAAAKPWLTPAQIARRRQASAA
jgi:hypothetical protein